MEAEESGAGDSLVDGGKNTQKTRMTMAIVTGSESILFNPTVSVHIIIIIIIFD